MLETAQILKEKNEAKFAVIEYDEFVYIKDLLVNENKLEDYLDYLHMQNVKTKSDKRISLAEVKKELAIH